jgi:hypothetical protein
MSEDTKPAGGDTHSPPWLQATAADLVGLDFEAPIAASTTADSRELGDLFHAAMKANEAAGDANTSAARVFSALSAVAGMHFKPHERNEPFGPMVTFTDGRRSAIPSDFRGEHANLLADMATRTKNPVLRARLADVCWLLDRKRGNLGGLAVAAYVEAVEKVDSGALKFRFSNKTGALQHGVRDYLRRAVDIGRAIGWEKAETVAARALVVLLRKRATQMRDHVPLLWFAELDLAVGASEPAEVATGIDDVLEALPPDVSSHIAVELWRLAARAYHLAKRDTDKYRCQSQAAERLASDAEAALTKQGSALLASHLVSAAIAQLHGLPDRKERRIALRHRLIDIQARIPDEMSVFSHELAGC